MISNLNRHGLCLPMQRYKKIKKQGRRCEKFVDFFVLTWQNALS